MKTAGGDMQLSIGNLRSSSRLVLAFRVLATAAVILIFLLSSKAAEAAKVLRSKGKAVLIEYSPDEGIAKGTRAFIIVNDKRVGLVRFVRVTEGSNRATAKLLKGRAPAGAEVKVIVKKDSSDVEPQAASEPPSDLIYGFVAGFGLNSQTVKAPSSGGGVGESVSLSGSGFSLKGWGDMTIADELGLIGRFGVETLNLTGTSRFPSTCSGTTSCKTELMYLSADLLARYTLVPGTWNPYLAAGLGLYYPLTKKTNNLEESKIAATTIFMASAGMNYRLGSSLYLPLSVEYGIFPPSSQVTTTFIAIRAGLAW